MRRYQRNVGFKAIYLSFLRRFWVMLVVFVPSFLAAFIITKVTFKTSYTSSCDVTKKTAFSEAEYNSFANKIMDKQTADEVVITLKEKNIYHENGSEISASEIISGLSLDLYTKNLVSVSITYESSDKTIAKPVLSELVEYTVNILSPESGFNNLHVSSEASEAKTSRKEGERLLTMVIAIGALSIVSGFIYEVVSDEVYDSKDIELLEASAFELKASK